MEKADDENLVAAFRHERPLYEAFSKNIEVLLSSLLRAHGISHQPIEVRTKTVESFTAKIKRPSKQAKYKVCSDVTDLAGIRVIVFYEEDVEKVKNIITDNFEVDEDNTVDKAEQMSPDRFGYLSSHFVCTHKTIRAQLTENKQFANLKCEMQVRTAVQHAWAVIDRNLRYNNEDDIPIPVKRKLFRVSALLEIADKEFSEINNIVTELRATYKKSVVEGNLNLLIDLDSINAYLHDTSIIEKINASVGKTGINVIEDSEEDNVSDYCLKLLRLVGFDTIEQLNDFLESKIQDSAALFDKFEECGWPVKSQFMFVSTYIIIVIMLSQDIENIENLIHDMRFSDRFSNALRKHFGTDTFPDSNENKPVIRTKRRTRRVSD